MHVGGRAFLNRATPPASSPACRVRHILRCHRICSPSLIKEPGSSSVTLSPPPFPPGRPISLPRNKLACSHEDQGYWWLRCLRTLALMRLYRAQELLASNGHDQDSAKISGQQHWPMAEDLPGATMVS